MLKADAFAACLDANLVVLQVGKPERSERRQPQCERTPESLLVLERRMRDLAKAHERCDYILPGKISPEQLLIRQGEFVREVVQAVKETAAELVVMPPERRGIGLPAVDIALSAEVPVLIARPPRSHNIVVAATNLADRRYPVIRQAGRIGDYLGAQIVLVHNIPPLAIPGGVESGGPVVVGFDSQLSARSTAQLQQLAQKLPRCTAAIVKSQLNTVQAILETGRKCDADLIVIGALREPSRIERLLGGNVSARVAEQALRSVLLTPGPPRTMEVSADRAGS